MDNPQPSNMPRNPQTGGGYGGKRPVWQWVVIYLVIAAIVYAVIYYVVIAKKGGYQSTNANYQYPSTQQNSSVTNTGVTNPPTQNTSPPPYTPPSGY